MRKHKILKIIRAREGCRCCRPSPSIAAPRTRLGNLGAVQLSDMLSAEDWWRVTQEKKWFQHCGAGYTQRGSGTPWTRGWRMKNPQQTQLMNCRIIRTRSRFWLSLGSKVSKKEEGNQNIWLSSAGEDHKAMPCIDLETRRWNLVATRLGDQPVSKPARKPNKK